jgi:hypothetical protein
MTGGSRTGIFLKNSNETVDTAPPPATNVSQITTSESSSDDELHFD